MVMDTKHIHISDFNYNLPDNRIAKFPLSQRDHSKLLLYKHGEVSEDIFCHLSDHIPAGSLMVFNNTRVIQARIHFRKETRALIEVFLMEPVVPADYEQMFQTNSHCSWLCMVGNLKKWKEGALRQTFNIKGHQVTLTATMDRNRISQKRSGTNYWINFYWDDCRISFTDILETVGELPIPPYLNRKTQESDKTTYQTVYSKIKGSVAAPTAGLHFTENVLKSLDDNGIRYGDRTIPLFKRIVGFDNVPRNFFERRAKYPNLYLNDESFSTYVGDFAIDYGPALGLIIIIIISLTVYNKSKIRGDTIYLHQLLILHILLYMCTIGGLKLFPFADAAGLQVIVYAIIYKILKISTSKVVKI